MRTGRVLLVLVPWIIMLGVLMPMDEPTPWYMAYMSAWSFMAFLLAYPAIIGAGWVDSPPGVGTMLGFVVLWCAFLSYVLWRLSSRWERRENEPG